MIEDDVDNLHCFGSTKRPQRNMINFKCLYIGNCIFISLYFMEGTLYKGCVFLFANKKALEINLVHYLYP